MEDSWDQPRGQWLPGERREVLVKKKLEDRPVPTGPRGQGLWDAVDEMSKRNLLPQEGQREQGPVLL